MSPPSPWADIYKVSDMRIRLLAIGAALATLAGCSQGITITAPTPEPKWAAVCQNALRDLPEKVAYQTRRSVKNATGLTAGWGDPVISLRCGVPRPAELKPTSQLVTVNSIDWFAQELTNGMRFTSMNTKVHIEVNVPSNYQPEGNALVDLTESLKELVILYAK